MVVKYIHLFWQVRKNKQELNPSSSRNILNRSPTSQSRTRQKDYRQRHIGHRDGLSQEHHVETRYSSPDPGHLQITPLKEEAPGLQARWVGSFLPRQSPERAKPTAFQSLKKQPRFSRPQFARLLWAFAAHHPKLELGYLHRAEGWFEFPRIGTGREKTGYIISFI